ncbi:helicase associated domain-containing protein [Arthrobacter sp.]|uniref:helicase associated domain-containing protein n=1 Tax=Arthrobacter sp. TaxID=1667 RepID=UPI00281163FE|nr:helicase associated domain-containing protein [Arthrobacter sp.]
MAGAPASIDGVPGGRERLARHKANIIGEEHELGAWLHFQRSKARRGQLDPQKAEALDAALPGWRSGRARGRRSRSQS